VGTRVEDPFFLQKGQSSSWCAFVGCVQVGSVKPKSRGEGVQYSRSTVFQDPGADGDSGGGGEGEGEGEGEDNPYALLTHIEIPLPWYTFHLAWR
jgi:hypothetical protein